MTPRACDRCTTRTWLVGRMAGHIENARGRLEDVLELDDDELIAAAGGRARERLRRELGSLDLERVRARSRDARLETMCRCDPAYPVALLALAAPPAVLHVAGGLARMLELAARDPVAIVGSRRASDYGRAMAASLGRSLGVAGVAVVSGMALGIDSAAHAGALEGAADHAVALEGAADHAGALEGAADHAGALEGAADHATALKPSPATIAVLPGSADRPYPAGNRPLHRRIVAGGVAVSELGPGTSVRRWMFLARNRVIAGLAEMTVVVESAEYSGSLVTARVARELGRPVGAVPGRVTSPQAAGPNALLAEGAVTVRGPQDVLDQLFGAGVRRAGAALRRPPPPELRALLAAIAHGHETNAALARAGFGPDQGLAALAALELGGFVQRGAGGRFSVLP